MGVWVGATHGGAFVFEDLHVGVLTCWRGRVDCGEVVGVCRRKVGAVDGGPGLDYGDDGGGGEVCESSVVAERSASVCVAGKWAPNKLCMGLKQMTKHFPLTASACRRSDDFSGMVIH